jgi:quinol monooxygenase YgiN
MSDGVTITMAITLKPEAVEPFCSGMPEMLKDTVKFAGFRDIRVVRNKENPNQVLLIENWDSEDAYKAYIKWRTERGDMDAMAGAVAAPPKLDVWPSLVAKG